MHLGRAFELLEGDTLAIFQGVGRLMICARRSKTGRSFEAINV